MAASSMALDTAHQESFILVAADCVRHIPAMVAALKDAGLKVESRIADLALSAVQAERLLRMMSIKEEGVGVGSGASRPSSARVSRPQSAGHAGSAANNGNQHPTASASSTAAAAALPPAVVSQRRFGSTAMHPSLTGTFTDFAYAPPAGRPPIEEAFSAEYNGPVTAILVACVDPRVNVVARLAALVGTAAEEDNIPAAAKVGTSKQALTFRQRFAPAAGIPADVACPSSVSSAVRSLHLLREYRIRQEAMRTAPPSTSPPGSSRGQRAAAGSPSALPGLGSTTSSLTAASAHYAAPTVSKSYLVDMDVLFDFIFPPRQQHPRSTGRLIVFALYGPLTAEGKLTGGRNHARTLTESEVNAAIDELEQDDILAVYTAGSVLGDVGQVLVDVGASSRGYPAMSRGQLEAMLEDLPRDSRGRTSFHDIQKRVLGARLQRVEDMRLMYPPLAVAGGKGEGGDGARGSKELAQTVRIRPAPKTFGRGKLAEAMELAHGRTVHGPRTGKSFLGAATTATTMGGNAGAAGGMSSSSSSAARKGGGGHFHPDSISLPQSAVGGLDVNIKMGPVATLRMQEALLHRNTSKIAELGEAARAALIPSMSANTKLVRKDLPGSLDTFDRTSLYALYPATGTRVPGSLPRIDWWRAKPLQEGR